MDTHIILLAAAMVIGSVVADGQTTKSKTATKPATEPEKEIAVVQTNMGTFEFELYRNDAPKTVENFVQLAEKEYFDGQRFHRVAKGFVIQGGDPQSKDLSKMSAWGTGGESIYGKDFEDELKPGTTSAREGYKKGVVAMANRGPNTNTSQFFVCIADVGLPHSYTIFGKVVKGLDVVEQIGKVEIVAARGGSDGRPKQDVMMEKVTIRREKVNAK